MDDEKAYKYRIYPNNEVKNTDFECLAVAVLLLIIEPLAYRKEVYEKIS